MDVQVHYVSDSAAHLAGIPRSGCHFSPRRCNQQKGLAQLQLEEP
jgi:hypothetical protein